jgi:hypothetical protein
LALFLEDVLNNILDLRFCGKLSQCCVEIPYRVPLTLFVNQRNPVSSRNRVFGLFTASIVYFIVFFIKINNPRFNYKPISKEDDLNPACVCDKPVFLGVAVPVVVVP